MGDLGLVHGYNHDQDTNSKACDSAASVEIAEALSSGLKRTSDTENKGADHDSQSATEQVTHRTGYTSSEETTACEKRHDGAPRLWSVLEIDEDQCTYTWFALGENVALNEDEATLPPMTPRS